MRTMTFDVDGAARRFDVRQLVIAGWTGRSREAVEHHLAELAAIGVRPPRTIPCFYRLATSLLTSASDVEVVGDESTGEVEFVLLSAADGMYVGIGSDHTDRKVEPYGVTVSKQICPKPIGRPLWKLAHVEPHWDRLILRSHVTRGRQKTVYQEGSVNNILMPTDLVAKFPDSQGTLARDRDVLRDAAGAGRDQLGRQIRNRNDRSRQTPHPATRVQQPHPADGRLRPAPDRLNSGRVVRCHDTAAARQHSSRDERES